MNGNVGIRNCAVVENGLDSRLLDKSKNQGKSSLKWVAHAIEKEKTDLSKLISTNESIKFTLRLWQADCIMKLTYLLPLPAERLYSLLECRYGHVTCFSQ